MGVSNVHKTRSLTSPSRRIAFALGCRRGNSAITGLGERERHQSPVVLPPMCCHAVCGHRSTWPTIARRMSERLFVRLDDDPLYAPETTIPGGTMREYTTPGTSRDLVAHVTAYEEVMPNGQDVVERILPDGALRLIFDLNEGGLDARVVGPSVEPVVLRLGGRIRGLSVKLRPGAALALFGVPAHELAGQQVPWTALATGGQRDLSARLRDAPNDATRVRVLFEVLQASRRDLNQNERRTAWQAAALFRGGPGERSVQTVASAVGLGERRLQQVFRAHIGLPPRTWARLARIHECLRLLRRPAPPPWHALAVDGGFYDQSHLINEFQALCGLTPEQFLRRSVSGSSMTSP
jgi:AraC-like DNA-binding protein